MVVKAPIISGMASRAFFKHLTIALAIGTTVSEIFWHFYVLPYRKRRDNYFNEIGSEYVHPFN